MTELKVNGCAIYNGRIYTIDNYKFNGGWDRRLFHLVGIDKWLSESELSPTKTSSPKYEPGSEVICDGAVFTVHAASRSTSEPDWTYMLKSHGVVIYRDAPEHRLQTTMTSTQTTQKTFKVGDRVVHVQDLVTVKSINPDGSVNTDKFFATSLDDLVLYVDPSKANAETKTDGVFQIGDRVRVIENGNVFVISEIQFSHPKTDNWYGRKHIEHYTNEMELAEIDKQIMKLIETKAKLINETKK